MIERNLNVRLLLWSYRKVGLMFVRGLPLSFVNRQFPIFVGARTRITGWSKHLHIAGWCKIEDLVEMQCVSVRGITLSRGCSLGRGVAILPSGYYSGQVGEGLEMGENSSIGPGGYVGASGYVRIGRNVIMGPKVSILAQNHTYSDVDRPIREQGVTQQGIVIEDDCWIGAGAIILDGVTVGRGCVIAAGAVVSRDVEPYSVVAGVPARFIRKRGGH